MSNCSSCRFWGGPNPDGYASCDAIKTGEGGLAQVVVCDAAYIVTKAEFGCVLFETKEHQLRCCACNEWMDELLGGDDPLHTYLCRNPKCTNYVAPGQEVES